MAGTIKRISGPAFLGAAAADIYTPPAATIYTVLKQIHIANVTAGAVTATLYIGGTGGSAAGTEILKGYSVAANSVYDIYLNRKMVSTDFLTGLASAGTSLTITVDGEQNVV
jgi:hypothetical protein